jgi:Ca-activated chloride channel family protein
MRFEHDFVLWFLLAVPIVLVWSLVGRRAAVRFSAVDRVGRIAPGWRERVVWVVPVLRAVVLTLLILGAARPQQGVGRERTVTRGVAMMLVVDRSLSMRAQMNFDGERVTRLDGMKRVLTDFVMGNTERGGTLPGRTGDLIGLIQFGGFAETVCPLVREYELLVEGARQMDYAATQVDGGTAIGDAIALAAVRLRSAESEMARIQRETASGVVMQPDFEIASKAIILLTDGEENRGTRTALEGAKLAEEWGIRVYPIFLGSASEIGAFRGQNAQRILRAVAETTGGKQFETTDGEGLLEIYAEIDKLEPTEIERVEFASYREWYRPFALAAGALLLLDVLLGWTLLRRAA